MSECFAGGEMWCLSLLSSIAVVLVVYVLVAWCRRLKRRAHMVRLIDRIPGPPSLPIIGNAIEMNVEHDGT
jgi:cytochrome P450 family 4